MSLLYPRLLLAPLLLLGFLIGARSQGVPQAPCMAEEEHIWVMGTLPQYGTSMAAVRGHQESQQPSDPSSLVVHTLPVVVHVVHRGSAVGVEENISDAQIFSAIDGLNQDFRKVAGSNGDGAGVDTFIQFELAQRTPHDEPTNGIVRVDGRSVPGFEEHGIASSGGVYGADQVAVKSLTSWGGTDYINVFVVPEINGNNGAGGTQGFAFLGPTLDARDGIVVLHNAIGLVGNVKPETNLNRTLTHEMGHHLSLFHTFSNTSSCGEEINCAVQGDEVCDTPPTTVNDVNCSTASCEGAILENYMDYTPQHCQNMFTAGQRARMRSCLETARLGLLESAGTTPVAEHDLALTSVGNDMPSTCFPEWSPLAVVTNLGVDVVGSFGMTAAWNGGAPVRWIVENPVGPGESVEVPLPAFILSPDTNRLAVSVTKLVGPEDGFEDNNAVTTSMVWTPADVWTLTLETGLDADNVGWQLVSGDGDVVEEGGNYPNGLTTYTTSFCVPDGCHTLRLTDSGGGGLCAFDFNADGICDLGGGLLLTDAAGDTLAFTGVGTDNFGSEISWDVCASGPATLDGCADVNGNAICDGTELNLCPINSVCWEDPGAACTDHNHNGLCDAAEQSGCTYAHAPNFNPSATMDDGSCQPPCPGDFNTDGSVALSDLLDFLAVFGTGCD